MKRSLVVAGLLVFLSGALLVPWGRCSVLDTFLPEKKPKTTFYFGLPEKRIYSKSVVNGPVSRYVFQPVLQFDLVEHDFIVRNTSDRMLELRKVQACCGSLVESYTRQIPPGKEGVIKTVLLTDRRGGEEIRGTIRAVTSDPEHPEWTIDISCFVEKFADISDNTIYLNGSWRMPLEGSSTVVPAAAYPFRITGLKPRKGRDITFGYREVKQSGKRGYLITVKNTRKEPGVIRDAVYVQTDNAARPEFMIRVQGRLTD